VDALHGAARRRAPLVVHVVAEAPRGTAASPGRDEIAPVLDAGAGGLTPASVIDLTKTPPEVLREGAGPVGDFV